MQLPEQLAGQAVTCSACGSVSMVPPLGPSQPLPAHVVVRVQGTSPNGFGLASLIIGLVGLPLSLLLGCLGIPLLIVGLALGVVGIFQSGPARNSGRGLAIAGTSVCGGSILLGVLLLAGMFFFFGKIMQSGGQTQGLYSSSPTTLPASIPVEPETGPESE